MKAVFTAAALSLALAGTLAGCGRAPASARSSAPSSAPPAEADDSGYHAPPRPRDVARASTGVVSVTGDALPGSTVRLASPDGRAAETTADGAGKWTLDLPPGGPGIYGLSQEADGRRDQAQGYLAVLPGAAPVAAELRSGAGARLLANAGNSLRIEAVDFDGAGAAVVTGWAAGSQPLRVLIDGAVADESTAAASGRFSLQLPKPLSAGRRTVRVVTPDGGAAEVAVDVGPPPAFAGAMRAVRRDTSWRIDWKTPAGGAQTTELFPARETKP